MSNKIPSKITYAPRDSELRYDTRTGEKLPVETTHFLEANDGTHLGIVTHQTMGEFDSAAVARLFVAAPELLAALKEAYAVLQICVTRDLPLMNDVSALLDRLEGE